MLKNTVRTSLPSAIILLEQDKFKDITIRLTRACINVNYFVSFCIRMSVLGFGFYTGLYGVCTGYVRSIYEGAP